jgi:hypothetical protein
MAWKTRRKRRKNELKGRGENGRSEKKKTKNTWKEDWYEKEEKWGREWEKLKMSTLTFRRQSNAFMKKMKCQRFEENRGEFYTRKK